MKRGWLALATVSFLSAGSIACSYRVGANVPLIQVRIMEEAWTSFAFVIVFVVWSAMRARSTKIWPYFFVQCALLGLHPVLRDAPGGADCGMGFQISTINFAIASFVLFFIQICDAFGRAKRVIAESMSANKF